MFPTTDCITFDCSSFTILCCLWLRSLNRFYDIGSEFNGNDGHYYGRIVVSAETPVFCPALETVAETAGGECVLEGVHDSLSKGFVKHCWWNGTRIIHSIVGVYGIRRSRTSRHLFHRLTKRLSSLS